MPVLADIRKDISNTYYCIAITTNHENILTDLFKYWSTRRQEINQSFQEKETAVRIQKLQYLDHSLVQILEGLHPFIDGNGRINTMFMRSIFLPRQQL